MNRPLSLLISVFVALLSVLHVAVAHNVRLGAAGRECFFEDLRKGDQMAVTYQVGDQEGQGSSGYLGIDFWINDPQNAVLKAEKDVPHGEVTFTAQDSGRYVYCFSNEASGFVSREVGFNVHGVVYVDATETQADPLENEIKSLSTIVDQVKDELQYLLLRERMHRNTAESTNSRVKWWSLFQLGVVAGSGIFQVYYLKRFFEVKSVV
ncbi:emp24/gp25L/p24 family/GOLD-domain-containing protein [Lipomyces orientalis]|uniref:Emp24/gp25L/p24 family/GOLD-domain-containing protein n=1 Tax=Lipomyces orientalis TaxID=1233043 RepID=A0ACC3TFF7_9ASCO